MRTIVLGYAATSLICAVVLGALWFRYRKQYRGLGYWFADYILQCFALVVLVLRGVVPDLVSMTIGNAMAVGGTMLLYAGLGHFTGKPAKQWHNAALLVLFCFLHGWFVLVTPNLGARTIIFSAGSLWSAFNARFSCSKGTCRQCVSKVAGLVLFLLPFP